MRAAFGCERRPGRTCGLRWTGVTTQPQPDRDEPVGRYRTPPSFQPLIYLCLPMAKPDQNQRVTVIPSQSPSPGTELGREGREGVSKDQQKVTKRASQPKPSIRAPQRSFNILEDASFRKPYCSLECSLPRCSNLGAF